jgi:hypothetical protein
MRAIAIQAWVFIVLGGIQLVAISLILFYASRYEDDYCPSHTASHRCSHGNWGESALR